MDVQVFRVAKVLKKMSHQDESIMRALSTETNTDDGTSCAEKQNELLCT